MRVKVSPVCPACKAPHTEEVEPGIMITCPDCDERYRAEAPEIGTEGSRLRGRKSAAAEPAAKAKKPRRKGDKLGKLIEVFAPVGNRAALLTIGIGCVVLGVGTAILALVAVGGDAQMIVLGVGGVLLLVAAVCLLRLKFGGSNSFFAVHKKGVRFKTRRDDQFLYWDEIDSIDIRREAISGAGRNNVRYEVTLYGSEVIELPSSFLASLDDPRALIKAIKEHSGKDFDIAVG